MELMQASARDSDVKKLYKYRVFDKDDSDYVKRIFTHKELYIPSPSQLNDPFECKPRFIIGDLSSPSYQKKHEEFFLRLQQQKSHVNKTDFFKRL